MMGRVHRNMNFLYRHQGKNLTPSYAVPPPIIVGFIMLLYSDTILSPLTSNPPASKCCHIHDCNSCYCIFQHHNQCRLLNHMHGLSIQYMVLLFSFCSLTQEKFQFLKSRLVFIPSICISTAPSITRPRNPKSPGDAFCVTGLSKLKSPTILP